SDSTAVFSGQGLPAGAPERRPKRWRGTLGALECFLALPESQVPAGKRSSEEATLCCLQAFGKSHGWTRADLDNPDEQPARIQGMADHKVTPRGPLLHLQRETARKGPSLSPEVPEVVRSC